MKNFIKNPGVGRCPVFDAMCEISDGERAQSMYPLIVIDDNGNPEYVGDVNETLELIPRTEILELILKTE